MHLARMGNEVDGLERDDRAEMLADAARFEERGGGAAARAAYFGFHASGKVLAHQSSGRLASVAFVDAAVSR